MLLDSRWIHVDEPFLGVKVDCVPYNGSERVAPGFADSCIKCGVSGSDEAADMKAYLWHLKRMVLGERHDDEQRQ